MLEKIIGTHSSHELRRIRHLVRKIEGYRPKMLELSDDELRAKTMDFKERYQKGESLDHILPEAYAVVREAARRVLHMEPYRVQIIGGIILHQGRIAEMRTGEGKTLVATMPAYLNALTGRGVHVITVNDYLAARDSEQMGQVHEFLGLTVGTILSNMNSDQRRIQYACDITYVTNNEAGFDYLRDNMAARKQDVVQRGLVYAIIDEVDSVLIDEARTPLIISGMSGKSTEIYTRCNSFAKTLERGEASAEFSKMNAIMGEEITETGDFIVNEKDKFVTLTERGVKKAEQYFHITNLSDPAHLEIQHCINLALRANNLMFRDQDYVVKDDQIFIVDEFTGRIMDGRRYSDGLHQAVEAKEGVTIKQESQTLATVTFQNFFNKYEKKAGMTGTAQTEEQEFRDIYGMDVIQIPTNRPVIRKDLDDMVFLTKEDKFNAVCDEIERAYKRRQPVLVGTVNIDTSELLSDMLKKRGIPHQVLNAKYHDIEAEIVSHAGEAGTVTIATNMAGRGTDIKLDDEARSLGGLKIIGTERHESRRIDNQLRGRSGRQGDPGESRFYLSLEDDLIRLFASEKTLELFKSIGTPGQPLVHKSLSAAISKAQKRIEDNNYGTRKSVLEYDMVNNEQREIIYAERAKVLNGDDMRDSIMRMIDGLVDYFVETAIPDGVNSDEWDLDRLNEQLGRAFPFGMTRTGNERTTKHKLKESIYMYAKQLYAGKEKAFLDPYTMRRMERRMLLRAIDMKWKAHLDDLDQLKSWIGIQAYGQKDPKLQYRIFAYQLFDEMIREIQIDTLRYLFSIEVQYVQTNSGAVTVEVQQAETDAADDEGLEHTQEPEDQDNKAETLAGDDISDPAVSSY